MSSKPIDNAIRALREAASCARCSQDDDRATTVSDEWLDDAADTLSDWWTQWGEWVEAHPEVVRKLDAARERTRWRSVEDELPEAESPVAVCDAVNRWSGESYFDRHNEWLGLPEGIELTHWRPHIPLPPPPEDPCHD